ncbi:MAG: GGDEF domain-containing protein [Clostridiales bacterium]|nr:GGDEF domain-containing protein [Clostridiales bacterium]
MTDNIIFEYNVKKNTVVFSNNFNSKFSFRAKTQKFSDCFFANAVVHRKENLQFQEFISKMLTGVSVQDEFRFKTLYNDYAWYILRCASIKDSEDNITKIVGAMIDIDRAKRREDGLSKKANYDSLTKIFNRVTFELTLLNEIELSQMRKYRIAVLFIDIDDFKFYNNDYGHALGDEVLVFIGETLKELVGHNGFAGRYGGDEFVICYNENPNGLSSGGFAQKIINKLGEGFKSKLIDKHFTVSCSIGIAYSDTTGEIDSIIKDADEAMYNVKKTGKSGYTYYSIPRED